MSPVALITQACLSFITLNPMVDVPKDVQELKCTQFYASCMLGETILDIRNETYRSAEARLSTCAQARGDGDY